VDAPERTAYMWCPDWSIVTATRRDPGLRSVPLVVVDRGERGLVVRAASAAARDAGVSVGLRRREAEARCAGLAVVEADDDADARTFEPVVRAVEQLVPRLVLERPGRLSFPTRGPSRYFGGDDALAVRVLDAVRGAGVPDARVGIADGELAAALAARASASTMVVPRGGSAAFLGPWSVGVLAGRVNGGPELVGLLTRLGLRTLADFAALPPAAVLGRFGAAGARAHRLARGESAVTVTPAAVPPELVETIELDPPASRVDEAAFAAKSLADRLLARLDELGLSCLQVVVEAETEHGERLTRCWRHEGGLTPAALVTRVRWQLDAWLTERAGYGVEGDADDVVTGGLTLLRLSPDRVVPAAGRQLGFWGGDAAAGDRAARVLTRIQGMLGPDAVVTAVPSGGRGPAERFRWVPWGAPREAAGPADAPWPGAVPGPAPARVLDPPVAAELQDAHGDPVTVSGRGDASGAPAVLRCSALPEGGGRVVQWSGPWLYDIRWWDRFTTTARRYRGARWQVVIEAADDTGIACLVTVSGTTAAVEAVYD
jgi:protein ImuB